MSSYKQAGYDAVIKAAGLEKEAVRPSHLLSAVRPSGFEESLERHFPPSWLRPYQVAEWVESQLTRNPKHEGFLSRSLTRHPASSAIRKQWPAAKTLTEKMEGAETRLVKDLRKAPAPQWPDFYGAKRNPEDLEVGFTDTGAVFDPHSFSVKTNTLPAVFLHEGRHAQQTTGAAGGVQQRRISSPRPRRERADTLMLERDANRYALSEETDPLVRAEMAAGQGTYEYNKGPKAIWEDAHDPHPEATPAHLRHRAARIKELRGKMYAKGNDLRDDLPDWVNKHQTVDASLDDVVRKKELESDFQYAQRRLRDSQALVESHGGPGAAPDVLARLSRDVEKDQQKLLRAQRAIDEMVKQREALLAEVDPRTAHLYDAIRRRGSQSGLVNEAIEFNRNPLRSSEFWRDATPEVIEANRRRHSEVRDLISRRLGRDVAHDYDAEVMKRLQEVGGRLRPSENVMNKQSGYGAVMNAAGLEKTASTALSKQLRFVFSQGKRRPNSHPATGVMNMYLGDRQLGALTSIRGAVKDVWVDPKFRGMGLGKKLYGETMRIMPGGTLKSDSTIYPEAAGIWKRLIGRPDFDVKVNDYVTPPNNGPIRGIESIFEATIRPEARIPPELP